MWSLFTIVHQEATPKFIGWHAEQLWGNLLKENPKRKNIPNNWRGMLEWIAAFKGVMKDCMS